MESFLVWYTTEDSFIIGVACGKKWEGFRSLKALEFEKWGLEPSSVTEVFAYSVVSLTSNDPAKTIWMHISDLKYVLSWISSLTCPNS